MTDRPKALKAVFLLTVFKILLAWTFVAVLWGRDDSPAPVELIAYTASAYVAIAIPTFVFIHRRNATGVRVGIVLAILVSLPVRAIIGIALDVAALALTWRASSKSFFAGANQ